MLNVLKIEENYTLRPFLSICVVYFIFMIPFVLNNALTLEKLGKVIRQRCKQLNLTLEDIESVTGISRKTLIKLEKGGDVRFSTLTTVISFLGLRLDLAEQKAVRGARGDRRWQLVLIVEQTARFLFNRLPNGQTFFPPFRLKTAFNS